MKKISVIIIFFCLSFTVVFCQNNSKNQDNKNGANIKKEYKALSIAFYNVENLFDTIQIQTIPSSHHKDQIIGTVQNIMKNYLILLP